MDGVMKRLSRHLAFTFVFFVLFVVNAFAAQITPDQDPVAYQPLPFSFQSALFAKSDVYNIDWVIGLNSSYNVQAAPPGLFRVFVPPGTRRLGVVAWSTGGVQDAPMSLRLGSAPGPFETTATVGGNPLTEQATYQCSPFCQPVWQFFDPPIAAGAWLYGANAGALYALQVAIEIDRATYDAWAKGIEFTGGNPPIVVLGPDPETSIEITIPSAIRKIIVNHDPAKSLTVKSKRPGKTVLRLR